MQKVRYEIDPFNRLITDSIGAGSGFREFRKVLDGQFKIDKNNSLSYHIKYPTGMDESVPNQLKISGSWVLTDKHELQLTVDKEARETFGDKITFSGRLLDVNANSLLFSMTTKSADGVKTTYVLDLQGSWKADKNNRLSFSVKREEGRNDILTLSGSWSINDAHQVVYRYEKADLARKYKEEHTLIFKGHWDVWDNVRVSYILDGLLGSSFDFRSSICALEKNYIKFEVGIGLKPVKELFVLFGQWRVKKDAGLLFEIEYENRDRHVIIFGADVKLADKDTFAFTVRTGPDGTKLALKLDHKVLEGDGELLLSALGSKNELAIYAGAAWRW